MVNVKIKIWLKKAEKLSKILPETKTYERNLLDEIVILIKDFKTAGEKYLQFSKLALKFLEIQLSKSYMKQISFLSSNKEEVNQRQTDFQRKANRNNFHTFRDFNVSVFRNDFNLTKKNCPKLEISRGKILIMKNQTQNKDIQMSPLQKHMRRNSVEVLSPEKK